MGTRENYQSALIGACMMLGDESKLAMRLQQPVTRVVDWMLGYRPIPTSVFLAAVDIVIEENQLRIADARVFLDEVRRRNSLF